MTFVERYVKATPHMGQEAHAEKTPGQIAHDAYHQAHGDGPFSWEHVREADRQAWEATALAIIQLGIHCASCDGHSCDDPPPFWKPDYHGLFTE